MSVVAVPELSRWVGDVRGHGRGLRVTTHAEAGLVVLSAWRGDRCAATVRLLPAQAAALVAGLTEGLAALQPEVAGRRPELPFRPEPAERRPLRTR
ncbi:hypothetical protein MF406_07305 [Georgenia sp. TF02-10]|uniref:hypothetical protein n=1 Tax=Georgenia sp. TF02-10 TaxID=2917725 RepID=UPI001FA775AB|nr:hypothetical protein [Georgenia sp. TF02-10]UNX56016.1 hypothetical protein MF406_07305 [Georgenia sp. TF02-10]